MDWVSATYSRIEVLAVAADRALNTLVERGERWLVGRGPRAALGRRAGKGQRAV